MNHNDAVGIHIPCITLRSPWHLGKEGFEAVNGHRDLLRSGAQEIRVLLVLLQGIAQRLYGGTPSHHPFINGIVPINHPLLENPHLWKPPYPRTSLNRIYEFECVR